MSKAAFLVGVLAVAVAAPARPQDEESKSLRAKLRTIRLDVDFSKVSVKDFVDYLREAAGINIVLSPKAAEVQTALTIKAKDVTIQSLLRLLLKPVQLGYKVEDGVLLIVRESDLKSDVRLEIIDVRDLLMPIQDFPGGEITLATDSLGANFSPAVDEAPKEFPIVDLIKAHTGSKSWDENSRTSLGLMNGLLFVRQTEEVIQQIRKVLDTLRRFK
ncbi:MAG TPA: STN domain-containing protein [Planctomycetota bacterium]|nr:STN domain-containing protein [Planctomycetota bacterium]